MRNMPNIFGSLKRVYGQYLVNDALHSLYTHVKCFMIIKIIN